MLLMPLTYSIAYGIIGGMALAVALWIVDTMWEVRVCTNTHALASHVVVWVCVCVGEGGGG
jgi:xanthine/uracil/vitamin C permease (AzgA family)